MMMSVPRSVGLFLSRAIARVRRLTLLRGCALVGIVWTLCVVAVMAVDSSIVIFDDRVRFAMAAGIALLTLLTALLAVVRPFRRRTDFGKMARTLDARHPELEERFSTLVELASADADRIGFSRALYSMIGDLAERDVAKIDLRREFSAARTLCWLAACLLFLLTLAAGIAVRPDPIGRLFVRAIAPWADIGNLFAKEISVKPGDIVALSGTVIRIEARPSSQLSTRNACFIRISRKTPYGWSEETSELMANGVYETTADLNEREWRYRVTAGRAVTKYYHVRVSEMPKYDLFTARVTYPSYTGWRPLVLTNAEVGAITAIQGSKVRFDVRASDPGTFCDFRIGKVPAFEHTMVSNKTTNWSLELVNRDGFRASKGKHPLTSFVDQPPSVVLEKPTGTLRLPPHAKIPVEITGSDDVAITSAYLRVSIDGEPWARHFGTRIELPDDPRFLRTVADVDLSLYNLVFARNIRFDVVVEDACPPEFGGPHSATSMPFTVQFAENEANYEMQELKNTVAEARRDIDEAKKRLNDAQNLARQVRDELRRNPKVQESTEQKSERLAHELTEAEKRIESLRDAFAEDERLAPLTRPMDRLLEDTLKPTLEQVENAQFRERGERADEVDAAIPELQKAVQELDELQGRLSDRAAKVDAFEKAKDLAARQAALAKAAKDILGESPQDKAKIEAWKRLEEAASRKADELIRQNPLGDFDEAKRKMETAAREMAGRKATDAQALQELRNAANDEKRAEQMLKTPNPRWPGVGEAQRTAEDRLERADATDAVKAYQRQATAAAQVAQEAPKDRQGAAAAQAAEAQRAAQEALKQELAVREQMAKGEKTEADLQALDAALGEQLLKATAARAQAAEAAAEQAVAEARDAVGDAEQEDVDRLADAALEARREAVRAARAESELRGDEGRTESLRDLENALSAQAAESAEATELEKKINTLQQAAMDAFKRRDRNRGISQQRETAREQRRAADAGTDAEDAVAARREANAAQAAAQQAAESVGRLDNETSEGVLKAQEAAMEAERTAQAEAQMARALAKIAAAERELPAPSDAEPPSPSDAAPALQAAEAAAEILAREVNAQAASLGMSKPDLSEPVQSGNGQKDRENGPGGVNAEVNRLAKELARKDDVNFFQKLFARLGWFKIRGASRDGLSEHDLKDVPREYRDLVRRYFLKLSEENP